ncbi:unnamed protein product [Parajaminaea phylloscopi]
MLALIAASAASALLLAGSPASASSLALAPRAAPENLYNGAVYGSGCYRDDGAFVGVPLTAGDPGVPNSYASGDMSNEACSNYCGDLGFKFSGNEYARECYCSNTAPKTTSASNACFYSCPGAPSEKCGGNLVLNVWANAGVRKTVSKYGAKVSGCFYDLAGQGKERTLKYGYTVAGNMTQEYCANLCGDKDYRYAGIEYGQECMCSNDAPTVTAGATCDSKCAGDSTQSCGGSWALTVLENQNILGNPTTPNGNVQLGPSYSSKGCFGDNVNARGRTLRDYSFTDAAMTVEKCAAGCSAKGLAYSGVEYGSECHCGKYAPIVTSTACTMPCAGNKRETCGGPDALSVYFDSAVTAAAAPVCDNLPAGYVVCTEGQRVTNGVCV